MNEMSETVNADFWKNRRVWVVWIGIFIASLTWRLFLIGKYPIVYSFDAFIRIWDADELFVRHWLPLPHLPIMFAHAAGLGLKTLRYFFAFFSAASIVTIGIAISRIYRTHLLGVTGALLIGSLGNYIVWSVVPYQEGLMFTFLGLFLMFSPYVHDNLPDRFYWTAGIFLMMASLCRYEVWILTVIILIRFLYTRRFRIVLSLLPGLIIPVIWVVIYQFVDVHTGPPRSEHALEPINLATLSDPGTIVKLSSGVLVRAFSEMVEDLGWIGALILPVGILFSLRNSCRWGRELVIFWAALAGLVFVRGINSHGVLTMRMFVPLNVIAV
nr:hypothetical protein [bacterium]